MYAMSVGTNKCHDCRYQRMPCLLVPTNAMSVGTICLAVPPCATSGSMDVIINTNSYWYHYQNVTSIMTHDGITTEIDVTTPWPDVTWWYHWRGWHGGIPTIWQWHDISLPVWHGGIGINCHMVVSSSTGIKCDIWRYQLWKETQNWTGVNVFELAWQNLGENWWHKPTPAMRDKNELSVSTTHCLLLMT